MAIAWSGATQSRGHPRTEYQYDVKLTNRTNWGVHVWVGVRVRMTTSSSYFSYAIGHHCRVKTSKSEIEQAVYIKKDRHMWGHQWAGSWSEVRGGYVLDWTYGSYDYNGKAWHPQSGYYTVFDGDIQMSPEETTVQITPCINRPPITNNEPLEKTCWLGESGIWTPWASNAHWGGYYAYRINNIEDGAFMNNRGLEPLAPDSRLHCGPAPKPAKVTGVTVTPRWIDCGEAEKTKLNVRWNASSGASKYMVYENRHFDLDHSWYTGTIVGEVVGTSLSYQPKIDGIGQINGTPAFVNNEEIQIDVYAINSAGELSDCSEKTEETWVHYHENTAEPPYSAYIVARHARSMGGERLFYQTLSGIAMHQYDGTRGLNEVAAFGENEKVRLYYWHNWYSGSYPVVRLQFVRVADNKVILEWRQKNAKRTSDEVRGNGWEYVEFKMPPQRPKDKSGIHRKEAFELRAFDKFGREVKSVALEREGHVNGRFRVNVTYYGDAIWVKANDEKWYRGLTFVHDGKGWREANGDGGIWLIK